MKHWEFWPARLFEAPYYTYLGLMCLRHALPPKFLAKANSASHWAQTHSPCFG